MSFYAYRNDQDEMITEPGSSTEQEDIVLGLDESDQKASDMDSEFDDAASCPEVIGNSQSYAEDYQAFKSIDRDEEDKLVCQYHVKKNPAILLRLLNIREQTLRYMARKYAYLDNEDDMYSEFKGVWLKCVKRYDWRPNFRPVINKKTGKPVLGDDMLPKMVSRKTPFNTYLYTSMKNRVWNILKKRYSKRMLDANGKPAVETMHSLDYAYGQDGDMTLKDILSDDKSAMAFSRAEMADMMKHLGADDPDIARTVDTFINNPRFATLTAACNYRLGTLRINKWDTDILSQGLPRDGIDPSPDCVQKAMAHLQTMMESTGTYNGQFELVSFILHPSRVDFVVHIDDPQVLKKVKDAIMKCRKSMSECRPRLSKKCV